MTNTTEQTISNSPYHINTVTAENIEDVRETCGALDQRAALVPGAQTWGIIYQPGNQRGQMTRLPDGTGMICRGADSVYGEWKLHEYGGDTVAILTVEASDGDTVQFDESGNEGRLLSELCAAAAAKHNDQIVRIMGSANHPEGPLTLVELTDGSGFELVIQDPNEGYDATFVDEWSDNWSAYRESEFSRE